MASPSLSNQFTSSSLNSLRQSLSSASSFQATSGEEIPLSENIRYNHGEGGVSGEGNENLSQIPRRQSSSLQPQSQPPNNNSLEEEEEEGLIYY